MTAPHHPAAGADGRSWTPARIERLKELWSGGYSARQIADVLGYVTRSGVIGKIFRLGLTGRGQPTQTPIQRRTSARRGRPPKARFAPLDFSRHAEEANAPPVRRARITTAPANPPIPFLDRVFGRQCAFIVSADGEPTMVCGSPIPRGERSTVHAEYCDHHARACTTVPPRRTRSREERTYA